MTYIEGKILLSSVANEDLGINDDDVTVSVGMIDTESVLLFYKSHGKDEPDKECVVVVLSNDMELVLSERYDKFKAKFIEASTPK